MSKPGVAENPQPTRPERIPASVRQARIIAAFEKNGFVSITDLAEDFAVSAMTIRRDLMVLDKRGLLERTHGGAVPVGHTAGQIESVEPAFEQRRRENAGAKAAIALAAAKIIGPSVSIGIDVGTSMLALAETIAHRRDIRVFTNNLRVALCLAEGGAPVYTLAGQVRSPEFSIIGPQAVDGLTAHFLDLVFIGVSGIDENGFYDYSLEDTEVKRAFIENAGRVTVLCDATKFGRRALSRIGPLDKIDAIVTDAPPPADIAAMLERNNVQVIVAL